MMREAAEPYARMHKKPYSSNAYIRFRRHMAERAKIVETDAATALPTALPTTRPTAPEPESADDLPAPCPATEDSGR